MGIVMKNLVRLAALEYKGRDQGYPKRKFQLTATASNKLLILLRIFDSARMDEPG